MSFPERLLPLVDTEMFIIEKKIFQDRSRKPQKYFPSVHVYVVCLARFWVVFFFKQAWLVENSYNFLSYMISKITAYNYMAEAKQGFS